jgi:outer membrane protein
MRRLLAVFSLMMAAVIFAPVLAQAGEVSLSLGEAVLIALRDNKEVLLTEQSIQKARLKIDEARAALFPTLTGTVNWSRSMGLFAKDFATMGTQISARQYLYKGGKTLNEIKYNEYLTGASTALSDKAKQDVVLSVKRAFYALLLAREYAALNRAIVANTENHFMTVKQRCAAGRSSASDLIQIKASLDSVASAYRASLNGVMSLEALLRSLLSLDSGTHVRPVGALAYSMEDLVYDAALQKALRDRPEIKQYDSLLGAGGRAVEIAKAQGRPSVYASWDYYSSSRTSSGAQPMPAKGWQDYMGAGLVFSWPIFDGWATKARVEQAIVDLKSTQLLKEAALRDIVLDLKNSYLAYRDSLEKIKATESQIEVYEDQLAVSTQKARQGHVSSLDLDDSVIKYDISRFSHAEAVYDYMIARSQFDRARGEVYGFPKG